MTVAPGLEAVGLVKLLGIVIESASADEVTISMEIGPDHLQNAGILHGGVHCALVETAASIGGHLWMSARPGGGTVAGVNNNTDFLRSFRAGRVTATATPKRSRPFEYSSAYTCPRPGTRVPRTRARCSSFQPVVIEGCPGGLTGTSGPCTPCAS